MPADRRLGSAPLALLLVVTLAACLGESPTAAPSSAGTPTIEPSPSPSPLPSPSLTAAPSPTASAIASPSPSPSTTCPGSDRTPGAAAGRGISGTSSNWSGYVAAVKKTGVTCVEASWVEPVVTCPPTGHQAVAIWIGIDGFSSRLLGIPATSTLVQLGTQVDCHSGLQVHGAWREVLPAEPQEVSILGPVRPGDHVRARIIFINGRFVMTLLDAESGLAFSLAVAAPGAPRRSAEWIVEAPATDCPDVCKPVALPKFSAITFRGAHATIAGQRAAINDDRWTNVKLTMSRSGILRTRTSGLSLGGTSFRVTWVHS